MSAVSTEASSSGWASKRERLYAHLFAPVDIASLAIFRICFGAIMFWEVWRYFAQDRVTRYYVEPELLFKYYGFTWVEPWPGDGMYWHFILLGVLSLFVMVGLFYRLSTILLFPAFTYVFLLDQARYLNHFYLVSLICLLMIFIPAHRALSIDALIWRNRRSDVAPAWTLWLMRLQLGIVYLYASFAKMNADWLRNEPPRMWLAGQTDRTLIWDEGIPIGQLFTQEWFVQFYTWGGLLFDLLIVPALMWRRTRALAFAVCLGFHLMNAWVFSIGIFPWFMICATTLFFEPDWPRKAKLLFAPFREGDRPHVHPTVVSPLRQRIIVTLMGIYLAVQLLVPFRHLLYPGIVHWNEEGHRWSWHMKLRSKDCRGAFFVTDPRSGATTIVTMDRYLAPHQDKALGRPDMILQFAHFLRDKWQARGFEQVEVRAKVRCSLNGRPFQMYVDPHVDLAAEPRTLGHVDWIVPLRTPLGPEGTE